MISDDETYLEEIAVEYLYTLGIGIDRPEERRMFHCSHFAFAGYSCSTFNRFCNWVKNANEHLEVIS